MDTQFTIHTPTSVAQIAAYHQLRYQELREPWGQPKGSEIDELEEQAVHRMVCNRDGNVIAVGRFHKVSMDSAQIRFMAVDKRYQGQGIGALLLNTLEIVAVKQGVKFIELNAREVALDFYQNCGYVLIKKAHTLYDNIVHYSMEKDLTELALAYAPQMNVDQVSHAPNKWHHWLNELGEMWHRTIPAAKAQGILPVYYDSQSFCVVADREATKNLHNTIFAGSIYTLATLTGWGWVYLLLRQQDLYADIVLGKADITYHKPLIGEPIARMNKRQATGNISVINLNKKARINIDVDVCDGDGIVATFHGCYFALPVQ